jgi:hypothetical protein
MFSDVWYVFGILNLCVYAEQNFPQLVEPFCFAGNDKMQASKNGEQRASPAAPAAPPCASQHLGRTASGCLGRAVRWASGHLSAVWPAGNGNPRRRRP